jgi:uncharacterized protein (DUF849 family)
MPQGAIFNVSAVGPAQLDAGIQSLLLGSHVRVGLEVNLYYSRGRLATNIKQVDPIVRIIRDMGSSPRRRRKRARSSDFRVGHPRVQRPDPGFDKRQEQMGR